MKNRSSSKRSRKESRANVPMGREIVKPVLKISEGETTFIVQENSFLRATDGGKGFSYTIVARGNMQRIKEGGFDSVESAIFAMFLRHGNI